MPRPDMTQAKAEGIATRTVAQPFRNEWPDWTEMDASPQAQRREQKAAKARWEAERFMEARLGS